MPYYLHDLTHAIIRAPRTASVTFALPGDCPATLVTVTPSAGDRQDHIREYVWFVVPFHHIMNKMPCFIYQLTCSKVKR
jgi:hypothetical protein